jgi:predicted enzyme related to lactoylglutathione lyase
MGLSLHAITFDCDDPIKVSAFWSAALGRGIDEDASPFFVSIGRGQTAQHAYFFIKVPEGKTVKNRVHLDLHAHDRESEVQRVIALGATRVDEKDEWDVRWTVMNDPEGNEFCIA